LLALDHGLRNIYSIGFSPDGKYFAASANDNPPGGGVVLWQVDDREAHAALRPRLALRHPVRITPMAVHNVCFSRDSRLLSWIPNELAVHLWDVAKGRPYPWLPPRCCAPAVLAVAFSPDQRSMLFVGQGSKA